MTKRNGAAILRARVEKELGEIREVVERVEKRLAEISFHLDWDELKPKAENLRSTFEKIETALQRFFGFLLSASEQIE